MDRLSISYAHLDINKIVHFVQIPAMVFLASSGYLLQGEAGNLGGEETALEYLRPTCFQYLQKIINLCDVCLANLLEWHIEQLLIRNILHPWIWLHNATCTRLTIVTLS